MDLSAFQLLKNSDRSNLNSRLHGTPLISYAGVVRVIDIQTVICEPVVQTSLSREVYTVTLLNLSSALLELNAYLRPGDTVLLLFLQRYDPRMFVKETVNNPNAVGYNQCSGVGVLMSTVKGLADTVFRCSGEPGASVVELTSQAAWSGAFNASMAVTFCRAVYDSEDERLINFVFGEGRPYREEHLAPTERLYGFWKNLENEWVELNAAVTEKYSPFAPVTRDVQGTQTVSVGLSTDKDGNPVETGASIRETVHGKSPITRSIRSPQTWTIGIGNDESGDAGEQREAPVNIELGEQADAGIHSMSGKRTYYQKDVIEFIGGDREETVGGYAKYTSADTDIESDAPVGINAGLYKSALKPYLDAETASQSPLGQAAQTAAPQLAILDAMSGGTGWIIGLGAAIVAFTEAMKAADTAAHSALIPVVK